MPSGKVLRVDLPARIPANTVVVRSCHGRVAVTLMRCRGRRREHLSECFFMKKPFMRVLSGALMPVFLAGVSLPLSVSYAATSVGSDSVFGLVVVSATRSAQPITDVVADVTVLDREQIERSGAVGLADVLARVPGLTMARNGGPGATTSLYLRGAEARFTAVFVDGVRIDSQSTGGVTWNAIPLSQVERIEVLRGPAAAVYGSDAVAGVVQIFTREGQAGFHPGLHLGWGSHGTLALGANLSGADDRVDYALGVNGERSTGFNALLAGNPDRDGYLNHSVSGRVGWKLAPGQKLDLSLLESRQKADFDGYTPGLDDQGKHHLQTLGLNWSARWSESWQTRASLSRGSDRYETVPSPYLTETVVSNWLLRNELKLGAGLLSVDLERREDELENASTSPVHTARHQNALALGYGLRAGVHALQMNLRHDDDSEFGGQTTGALAYGLAFSPTLRATASAGTSFRAPTLFQRFSIYGTPDLQAEVGRNVEAGLRWQQGRDRASVVVYRNRVKNLIEYVYGPGNCINGVGPWAGCYGSVGQAVYRGATLAGGTHWGSVKLAGSLDLMRPENAKTGKRLARRPETQATVSADVPWGGWLLGGEMQYVGDRFNNAANTQRLSSYTLWNLTASTALTPEWTLRARLDNLTDKDYQSVLGYATAGRTWFLGLNWAPR